MLKPVLHAAALLVLFAPATALATPITYTITGDFTGTLAGSSSSTSFTNSPFTWVETGDTSGLTTVDGFPAVQVSGNIDLPAIGAVTAPTVPLYMAINQSAGVGGFVDASDTEGLTVTDGNFSSYNLVGSLGPDNVAFYDSGAFATGLGEFDITSASNLVFTASLGAGSSVPEPGTTGLLGSGLVALFAARYLRRRNALIA